jgi:hypothetical protein
MSDPSKVGSLSISDAIQRALGRAYIGQMLAQRFYTPGADAALSKTLPPGQYYNAAGQPNT